MAPFKGVSGGKDFPLLISFWVVDRVQSWSQELQIPRHTLFMFDNIHFQLEEY